MKIELNLSDKELLKMLNNTINSVYGINDLESAVLYHLIKSEQRERK